MAGLIQRKNTWFACWWSNGVQVRKSTRVHVSSTPGDGGMNARALKKLAQTTADAMEAGAKSLLSQQAALAAVRAAFGAKEKEETLEGWAETWLKSQREKKSFPVCRKAILRFMELLPEARGLPLRSITPAMIDDWGKRLLDLVSGSTVDRDAAEVSAMFNRAVAERLIDSNPARGFRLPGWAKAEKMEREIFTLDQLQVIFRDFPGEWPDMVATCLLLGGLRLGDVAMLKWEQIRWESGLILVTAAKTNRGMTKPLIPALMKLFEKRKNSGMMGGGGYVFPYAAARMAQAGGKTSKLSIEFGKLLEEYGLRKSKMERRAAGELKRVGVMQSSLSFHSLRGNAVTFLLDGGVPPEMVRLIVGHDSPEIERIHYYKPSKERQAEAMQTLSLTLGLV